MILNEQPKLYWAVFSCLKNFLEKKTPKVKNSGLI